MIVNSLILLTAIGVSTAKADNNQTNDALKALAKATYVHSGLNKKAKKLEKKYIPKPVKKYGAWVGIGYKIVVEKRISFEWTF